jgi:hypothetical protein
VGFPYTCTLSISNPNGFDNFTSITGTHAAGKTDADVARVINAYGNTLNIPEVICRQFPNLLELQFANSSITTLTADAFANCENLQQAIVIRNPINSIPVDTFNGAPNLEVIHLFENSIVDLPSGIFDNLNSLRSLYLSGNADIQLQLDIFQNLVNLETLYLDWCGITTLEPQWFALVRLRSLRLQDNAIEDIPNGIFVNSPNLLDIQFQRNKLSEIRSASFSSEMRILNRILFHENQIAAIDSRFFDKTPNLFLVDFADNICVNKNITQFSVNREESLLHFIDCFNAFNPLIGKCQVYVHDTYGLTCELFNITYDSLSGPFSIEVDHGALGTTDDNITGLIFTTSHLEKVPREVFSYFNNLEYLQVQQSGLSEILFGSFEGCVPSLKFIDASYNCIKEIGGDAFTECAAISDIRLNHNCIYSIQPCKSFFVNKLGTLIDLDLKHNVCVDQTYSSIDNTVKENMKVQMRGCFGMWYD